MSGSSSRHVSFPRENDHRPGSAGPHWSMVPNRPIGSSSAPDSGQDEHQRCRRRDRTGSSESEKSSRPENEQRFGFVALCCICCWFFWPCSPVYLLCYCPVTETPRITAVQNVRTPSSILQIPGLPVQKRETGQLGLCSVVFGYGKLVSPVRLLPMQLHAPSRCLVDTVVVR